MFALMTSGIQVAAFKSVYDSSLTFKCTDTEFIYLWKADQELFITAIETETIMSQGKAASRSLPLVNLQTQIDAIKFTLGSFHCKQTSFGWLSACISSL